MLISTKGRYALRVLVDIAEHPSDGFIPLKEIADRQEISEKYLESITKELVKSRFLIGHRGKGGGYRIGRPPDQINVGEVLSVMEGSLAPVSCLEEGAELCPRASQCRTLNFWKGLDETISRYARSYSVADLMWNGQTDNDYVI